MRSRWLRRFILVAAVCLAAVLAGQATGRAAAAPSSGFNDGAAARRPRIRQPVVLLHGLGGNGPGNFSTLGPYLASAGYCAYAPTTARPFPASRSAGSRRSPSRPPRSTPSSARCSPPPVPRRSNLVGHSEGGFQAFTAEVRARGGSRRREGGRAGPAHPRQPRSPAW